MTIPTIIALYIALLLGHCLADFPLQKIGMRLLKDPKTPSSGSSIWTYLQVYHALIHGFFVYAITHNIRLGMAETICHTIIDCQKGMDRLDDAVDQTLHILCKTMWMVYLITFPAELDMTYISYLNQVL